MENIETMKISQLKADEKLEEYRRVTAELIKARERENKQHKMLKRGMEKQCDEIREQLKKSEDMVLELGKQIKMQALKIREIITIESPRQKRQVIKSQFNELKLLSSPNIHQTSKLNDDSRLELDKQRNLKIRYGGMNL